MHTLQGHRREPRGGFGAAVQASSLSCPHVKQREPRPRRTDTFYSVYGFWQTDTAPRRRSHRSLQVWNRHLRRSAAQLALSEQELPTTLAARRAVSRAAHAESASWSADCRTGAVAQPPGPLGNESEVPACRRTHTSMKLLQPQLTCLITIRNSFKVQRPPSQRHRVPTRAKVV